MKQQYDSYKPSSIDWIGDIPSHWQTSKLRYQIRVLTDFTANGSFGDLAKNVLYLDQPSYSRLVRLTDLRHNLSNEDGVWVNEKAHKYLSKSELFGGELLMANVGAYAGYVCKMPFLNAKYTLGPNMFLIKLQKELSTDFYRYLLSVGFEPLQVISQSSAQPKLNKENIRSFPIIIPPLAEQEAIAAWLDEKCGEIDAAIAKVDREIELIDELKQSEISRVVTRGLNPDAPLRPSGIDWIDNIPLNWSSMKLKHTVKDIETDFMDGDWIESSDISTEGIRYLTSGNIGPGYYKEQGEGFISEETFAELNCIEVFSGDLLISRLNEPIARTCFIPDLGYRIVTCVDNVIYRPIENLFDKRYMMYQLNSKPFWFNASQLSSGATMQRISRSKLGAIKVIVPPLTEQQAIADYLDKKCAEIDGLKAKLSKKRETLTELRQSIISEVVTGKRKVI